MNHRWARRAAGLAAVALLATACSSADSGVDAASSPPASVAPSDTSTVDSIMAAVDIEDAGATHLTVPGHMDWVTVAGGSAWMSNEAITRLDGRTGDVLSSIDLPGPTCLAPDVGSGSLWFGVCGTPEVLRIDPTSGKVLATIAIKNVVDLQEESSVAAGAGGVWVLAALDHLVQIDPRSNAVVRVADAPAGATAIRASKDALWLTVFEEGTLLKLDPRSLETLAVIQVGAGPRFLALGLGAAWTLDQGSGTVTRVDLDTGSVVATVRVDAGAVNGGDIAVGGGYVWARISDALVAKIDPRTNAVIARYGPAMGSGSVAADDSAAWVTAHDSDTVFRLPLT